MSTRALTALRHQSARSPGTDRQFDFGSRSRSQPALSTGRLRAGAELHPDFGRRSPSGARLAGKQRRPTNRPCGGIWNPRYCPFDRALLASCRSCDAGDTRGLVSYPVLERASGHSNAAPDPDNWHLSSGDELEDLRAADGKQLSDLPAVKQQCQIARDR